MGIVIVYLIYFLIYLIGFLIVVPEIFLFISLALSSESSVIKSFPKSNITWIDDIPISINKFFVDLPMQEKILWILIVIVVYSVLLVLIKYKDIYILFILSNIYVIYFIYTEVVYIFKLMVAWNIILTIVISLMAIGFRLYGFEIIRGIIEGIIDTILDIIFKISNIKYKGNIEFNKENMDFNKEESVYKQQEQYKRYEQYQESTSGNFNYNKEENNSKNKDDDNNEQYIRREEKSLKTSYDVLGVSKEDDIETIKKVYKLLSKTYHPDINSSALANDKFIEIKEAWEKISKERNYK